MLAFHSGPPATILSYVDIILKPRWLVPAQDSVVFRQAHEGGLFPTFLDCVRAVRPKTICLVRTYALGDILMLIPVIRAMRRALPISEPVTILMEERFYSPLYANVLPNPDVRFGLWRGEMDYGFDLHFDLNHALEADHKGGPESDFHRVELYAKALGMELAAA